MLNYKLISNPYTKVLEFYYSKEAPFSIDVSDVPTPQLPSAYAIAVVIADKPTIQINQMSMPVYMLNLVSDFAGTIE